MNSSKYCANGVRTETGSTSSHHAKTACGNASCKTFIIVKWWFAEAMMGELIPAMAEEQAKKELRETLANEVPDTVLDTEVGRVVKAANAHHGVARFMPP